MNWQRTQMARERLEDKLEYRDGVPYFKGRRVIERDSPIDEGVYVGAHGREAIVVRYGRSPKLKEMYSNLKLEGEEEEILRSVYDVVDKTLRNRSEGAVKFLSRIIGGPRKDTKISLNSFLTQGIGVCRHGSLACGALIERLIKQNVLKGKVSVDRNDIYKSAHAWCRYEDENGKATILDTRQGYFGSGDPSDAKWVYGRPEEKPEAESFILPNSMTVVENENGRPSLVPINEVPSGKLKKILGADSKIA